MAEQLRLIYRGMGARKLFAFIAGRAFYLLHLAVEREVSRALRLLPCSQLEQRAFDALHGHSKTCSDVADINRAVPLGSTSQTLGIRPGAKPLHPVHKLFEGANYFETHKFFVSQFRVDMSL
jgi:hypothetical protein